jgi:hypothetical protein
MTDTVEDSAPPVTLAPETEQQDEGPSFILYLDGVEYREALTRLSMWVHHLLLPVYGREVTSGAPWCTSWWQHPEAIAQLYGLWMSWQDMTGATAGLTGPAMWHRDFLSVTMSTLRDPSGPFAGCKPGAHRPKESPPVEPFMA